MLIEFQSTLLIAGFRGKKCKKRGRGGGRRNRCEGEEFLGGQERDSVLPVILCTRQQPISAKYVSSLAGCKQRCAFHSHLVLLCSRQASDLLGLHLQIELLSIIPKLRG